MASGGRRPFGFMCVRGDAVVDNGGFGTSGMDGTKLSVILVFTRLTLCREFAALDRDLTIPTVMGIGGVAAVMVGRFFAGSFSCGGLAPDVHEHRRPRRLPLLLIMAIAEVSWPIALVAPSRLRCSDADP